MHECCGPGAQGREQNAVHTQKQKQRYRQDRNEEQTRFDVSRSKVALQNWMRLAAIESYAGKARSRPQKSKFQSHYCLEVCSRKAVSIYELLRSMISPNQPDHMCTNFIYMIMYSPSNLSIAYLHLKACPFIIGGASVPSALSRHILISTLSPLRLL
jgi:hypothetical protein